jgi:hypothetical protein
VVLQNRITAGLNIASLSYDSARNITCPERGRRDACSCKLISSNTIHDLCFCKTFIHNRFVESDEYVVRCPLDEELASRALKFLNGF